MKKKILPIMVLTVGLISGLASCKKDVSSSTSNPNPSNPTPSTSEPAKSLYTVTEAMSLFSGSLGETGYAYNGPTTITVQGIYFSTGDGNYYDGRAGYLQDEKTGDLLYMHYSAKGLANIATEVLPGAVIKVTGNPTVYNNLPQIDGNWKYELVTATSDAAVEKLYKSYTETTIENIYGADGKVNKDVLLKPIKITNAVLTSPSLDSSGLTYFTALSDINKADAKTIGLYRFKTTSASHYYSGGLYDIYAVVTAYKLAPQLHVNAVNNDSKFKSVQEVPLSDLDDETMLSIQKLYTDVALSDLTFDFRQSTPVDIDITLRRAAKGALVVWTVDANDSDHVVIEEGSLKDTLKFKAGTKQAENKDVTVKIKRKVCVGDAAGSKDACLSAGEGGSGSAGTTSVVANYFEEEKTVKLSYVYTDKMSVTGTFDSSVPAGFKYITNNEQFPNPSYGSDGTLKLAYTKGGFQTDVIGETQKAKLTINLKVDEYCKAGNTCTEHSSKVTVSLLGKDGTVIGTVDSAELFDAAKTKEYRDIAIDLDAGTAKKLVAVKVILSTSTNSTLYVKTATLQAIA